MAGTILTGSTNVYQPGMSETLPQRMKRPPIVSVVVMGIAVQEILGAFYTTTALQSTVNWSNSLGVGSVAVYYAGAAISSVLTFLLFKTSHWKPILFTGLAIHLLYIFFNMYARFFTLITLALAAGLLSGPVDQIIADTTRDLTQEEQVRTGHSRDHVRRKYTLILFLLRWSGAALAALIAGGVLRDNLARVLHLSTPRRGIVLRSEIAYVVNSSTNATASPLPPLVLHCGGKHCPNVEPPAVIQKSVVNTFVALGILGLIALILAAIIVERPKKSEDNTGVTADVTADNATERTPTIPPRPEEEPTDPAAPATVHIPEPAPVPELDKASVIGEPSREKVKRRWGLLVAAIKQKNLLMVLPLWFVTGRIQALIIADFFRAFAFCPLSISHVGFALLTYIIFFIVSKLVIDFFCLRPRRLLVVLITVALQGLLLVAVALWEPEHRITAGLYCIATLLGLCWGTLASQLETLQKDLSVDDRNSVPMLLAVVRSLGLVFGFALSGYVCMVAKGLEALCLLVIAAGMYIFTELQLMRQAQEEQHTESVHM